MDEKKRVSVTELFSDIQSGLSDSELMEKHGLSRNQLEKVFEKLVESGRMTQSEVDDRKALLEDVLDLDVDSARQRPYPAPPGPGAFLPAQPPANWQRKATIGIIGGLVLSLVAIILPPMLGKPLGAGDVYGILAIVLGPVGLGMQIWGCYYLVTGKGYHGALCILGVLCCVGLLILLLLPDKYKGAGTTTGLIVIIVAVVAVVAFAVVGIILAIAIPYYVSFKRTACDRAASADVAKLAASLERLGNELADQGLKLDDETISRLADGNALQYMAGPYYGWRGSTSKCEVCIRMASDKARDRWIIEGAAIKGSHPEGVNSRYIYRTPVVGGEDLPTERRNDVANARNGKSRDWNSYPLPDSGMPMCYTESMIQVEGPPDNRTFKLRTPKGVPCNTIVPD